MPIPSGDESIWSTLTAPTAAPAAPVASARVTRQSTRDIFVAMHPESASTVKLASAPAAAAWKIVRSILASH